MEELKETLKKQIIEALSLEDMRPEDIDDAAPLFGDGLGLDSIDALELIVLMEKQYGITAGVVVAHAVVDVAGAAVGVVGFANAGR